MANFFDDTLEGATGTTAPKKNPNFFDDTLNPVLPGTEPGAGLGARALRTIDDAGRATANALTFGLADRIAGALSGTGTEEEQRRSAEAAQRSPYASGAGAIAGTVVPAGIMSKGVGLAIPALGRLTLPAIGANQAITGAGMSAANDVIGKGEAPDPVKMATEGGISGLLGVAGGAISRYFFPSSRLAAADTTVTPDKIRKARDIADTAANNGVPINVPEAVRAADPGTSARITGAYNSAAHSPEGSQAAFNFNQGRRGTMAETSQRVADTLGPEVSAYDAAQAAARAIKGSEALVRESAGPYFRRAGPAEVNPGALNPMPVSIRDAAKAARGDELLMAEIPNSTPRSISFLDMVKSRLGTQYEKLAKDDPFKASLIARDSEKLNDAMKSASPDYRTATAISEQGTNMLVKPLKAGPMGQIQANSNNAAAQAATLFDVATPMAEKVGVNTVKRLRNATDPDVGDVPAGLLSTRIREAASRDPLELGRALPTEESLRVAREAGGRNFNAVEDAMRSARHVDTTIRAPYADSRAHGPVSAMYHKAMDYGKGELVELLNDPANIEKLGRMPIPQGLLQAALTGTTSVVAEEDPFKVYASDERRRRRRRGE